MPLLPLVQTRSLGSLRIHALQAGLQHLDGGAMFGVVPKNLWERKIPADAKNRIPLGMRCLLIEHPDRSEERRVGKEGRDGSVRLHVRKKSCVMQHEES